MSAKPLKKGLIVAQNVVIGYQLATLFRQRGWEMLVVHRDYAAYEVILREKIQAVVADIDSPNLGGLAVLTYCHHHYPSIDTYAVLQHENGELKKLAKAVAGCRDFFYLEDKSLQLDTNRGMAAALQPQG